MKRPLTDAPSRRVLRGRVIGSTEFNRSFYGLSDDGEWPLCLEAANWVANERNSSSMRIVVPTSFSL